MIVAVVAFFGALASGYMWVAYVVNSATRIQALTANETSAEDMFDSVQALRSEARDTALVRSQLIELAATEKTIPQILTALESTGASVQNVTTKDERFLVSLAFTGTLAEIRAGMQTIAQLPYLISIESFTMHIHGGEQWDIIAQVAVLAAPQTQSP